MTIHTYSVNGEIHGGSTVTSHWPLAATRSTKDALDAAREYVKRLEERLAAEQAPPEEPSRGTTIHFSKQHNGKVYDFAAIRGSNGQWYTTGSTCPTYGWTWGDLWIFINEALVGNVYVTTAHTALTTKGR